VQDRAQVSISDLRIENQSLEEKLLQAKTENGSFLTKIERLHGDSTKYKNHVALLESNIEELNKQILGYEDLVSDLEDRTAGVKLKEVVDAERLVKELAEREKGLKVKIRELEKMVADRDEIVRGLRERILELEDRIGEEADRMQKMEASGNNIIEALGEK
jgi:chromosome segregation ATPase